MFWRVAILLIISFAASAQTIDELRRAHAYTWQLPRNATWEAIEQAAARHAILESRGNQHWTDAQLASSLALTKMQLVEKSGLGQNAPVLQHIYEAGRRAAATALGLSGNSSWNVIVDTRMKHLRQQGVRDINFELDVARGLHWRIFIGELPLNWEQATSLEASGIVAATQP